MILKFRYINLFGFLICRKKSLLNAEIEFSDKEVEGLVKKALGE